MSSKQQMFDLLDSFWNEAASQMKEIGVPKDEGAREELEKDFIALLLNFAKRNKIPFDVFDEYSRIQARPIIKEIFGV